MNLFTQKTKSNILIIVQALLNEQEICIHGKPYIYDECYGLVTKVPTEQYINEVTTHENRRILGIGVDSFEFIIELAHKVTDDEIRIIKEELKSKGVVCGE